MAAGAVSDMEPVVVGPGHAQGQTVVLGVVAPNEDLEPRARAVAARRQGTGAVFNDAASTAAGFLARVETAAGGADGGFVREPALVSELRPDRGQFSLAPGIGECFEDRRSVGEFGEVDGEGLGGAGMAFSQAAVLPEAALAVPGGAAVRIKADGDGGEPRVEVVGDLEFGLAALELP